MIYNKDTGQFEFNPKDKYWVTYKGSIRYTTVFMNDNYMTELENGNYASSSPCASWSLKGWGCDVLLNEKHFSQDRRTFLKKHLADMRSRIKYYDDVTLNDKVGIMIEKFPELAI